MTDFAHMLSTGVMRALGWTLLHFLWQGLALAALGSAIMAAFRSSSVRYLVGLATLLLMFAAPVVTFLLFLHPTHETREDETWEAVAAPRTEMAVSPDMVAVVQPVPSGEQARSVSSRTIPAGVLVWLVQLWFLGVALFSLRAAGGFLLIERLRRKQAVPMNATLRERCLALQRRLGLDRVVRYCECQWLEVPAVIGWVRPMVLVPVTALTGLSEEQLEAVIVHELAHVKRWDSVVNLLQIVVETLLFYHPAVWWMNRRIRAERENCCDDAAISICGDRLQYARALTLLAERRSMPSLALAANGSPLAVRVARLLGLGKFERRIRSAGIVASGLCLSAALMAGNAFLGIAHAASDAASKPSPASDSVLNSKAPNSSTNLLANKDVQSGVQKTDVQNEVLAGSVAPDAASSRPPIPVAPQTAESRVEAEVSHESQASNQQDSNNQNGKTSYIEGLKSVGLNDLSVDQLVAMKIQGVTPDYVRGLQQQGMHPDANQLIGMKIQGVSPEYIRDMRAATGADLTAEQIVGMKIHGVTPDYVREARQADPHLSVAQLMGMKIQGVTSEYVKEMQGLNLHTDGNGLIGMKIQGVTPEYVRDIRATGLDPSVEQLIGMRIQKVTPAFIKALQSFGLKLKADEVIAAKIMGITPEFIEKARSHGFKDLDLNKLIALKHSGVL